MKLNRIAAPKYHFIGIEQSKLPFRFDTFCRSICRTNVSLFVLLSTSYFKIKSLGEINLIVFNYIIIFYNLIILKKKFAKKEGEELEEKILLTSESKLSKKYLDPLRCRTLEISAIKDVYASNNEFKNSELHSPYVFTRCRVSLGAGFIRRNSYHVVRDRSTTTVVATEEGRKITFCMRIAKSQETSIHSPLGEDGLRVHVRAPDP